VHISMSAIHFGFHILCEEYYHVYLCV